MQRRLAVWWGILLCALLACAPAHAKIVINQSIAGVSPGMTEKAIKAKLGKPTHVYKFKKQGSYPGGKELVWESRKGKERRYHVPRVFVTFVNGTPGAGSVGTSSRYERTSSRVGPGASYKLLRKRLKGENCSKPPHDCIAAAPAGVKLRTDFAMAWSNGKRAGPVERVTMYMVQPAPGSGSTSPPAPTQPTLPMDQFPVPDSNGKLVAGPDGAIWMNEPTTGAIARMSADGEVTEYPLPNRNDPTAPGPPAISIAAGPDAALWFTAFDGAEYAIGRMSTAGEVTAEYPLPLSTQLGDITAGPDGALWFEEPGTTERPPKIGRITTSGAINEYDLPGLTVEAAFAGTGQTITAGPDGAIWFLLADGRVARLNTSGQVAFFGGNPYGATTITAGPDGAVWFAVQGCGCTAEGPQSLEDRDKLVRITPDGTTKEFPTPEGAATNATPHNGGIVGIAAGPDGALWFTESDDNRIGRMTTSGEFTRYVIPVSDGITRQPQLIVAGPGRAMFFSEATQNVIGRVAVP